MAESVKVATEEGAKVTTTVTSSDPTAAAPAEPDELAAARARMAAIFSTITATANSTYVCGSDGSDNGNVAFETTLSLMKPKDFITCLHFYDSTKNTDGLPPKYERNNLRKTVETALTTKMRSTRWSLDWKDKAGAKTNDSVARHLNTLCDKADYLAFTQGKAPEFFVCGFHGRKGRSELGSVADLAMRRLHIPCVARARARSAGAPDFAPFRAPPPPPPPPPPPVLTVRAPPPLQTLRPGARANTALSS